MRSEENSWMRSLFAYADGETKRLTLSVVLSVLSVMLGLVPFYCMYRVICLFDAGTATAAGILGWCGGADCGLLRRVLPATTGSSGPGGIACGPVCVKKVIVVLFHGFQCGPDVGFLVFAGPEGVHVQEGGDCLCVFALGCRDRVLEPSVKGHGINLFLQSITYLLLHLCRGRIGECNYQQFVHIHGFFVHKSVAL